MILRTFNVLSRKLTGELRATDWTLPDPLTGTSSGTISVALDKLTPGYIDRLRRLTTPEVCGVVVSDDTNRVVWCGIIRGRPWKPRSGALELSVEEIRGWFYSAALRPGSAVLDTNGDYITTSLLQSTVAWYFALIALSDGSTVDANGFPSTTRPGALLVNVGQMPYIPTEPTRSLVGRRGDKVGDLLDTLSRFDGSVEWWLDTTFDNFDAPRTVAWTFRTSTERKSRLNPIRLFSKASGANIVYDSWPEDSSAYASSVTALGEGTPPDQLAATDVDPAIASGGALLREVTSGPYSGVVDTSTLFDLARTERVARADSSLSVQLTVDLTQIPPASFTVGDRAYVRIVDEWLDVEIEAARIIDRQLLGGASKPLQATITLNLANAQIPDSSVGVDTGGV